MIVQQTMPKMAKEMYIPEAKAKNMPATRVFLLDVALIPHDWNATANTPPNTANNENARIAIKMTG
jgi:hypothetical protein